MKQQELIPHLFRTEFQKIVAVLCKQFGLAQLQMAEDIAGEAFLAALETWPYQGLPQNPTAWLYAVAKNKLKNHLHRENLFAEKILPTLKTSPEQTEEGIDWSDKNITDSQAKMLFALSHPSLSAEAQIALSLRVLCGFGIEEIATAFLTNKETVNKRLYRAKEILRQNPISLDLPSPAEMTKRLDVVLKTLYLLFNEGYYSESSDTQLRKDFCLEAMRLTHLLTENHLTNQPGANALLSLMCFHASRFDARTNDAGEMILYHEQDETRWNKTLVQKGVFYLHRSAASNGLCTYHLEAAIAYWHTVKDDSFKKWEAILQLYHQLLLLQYSPIAALNRAYALAKVNGADAGIGEAESLRLSGNRFYHALLGELYKEVDEQKANEHLSRAISLTKSSAERAALERKLQQIKQRKTQLVE